MIHKIHNYCLAINTLKPNPRKTVNFVSQESQCFSRRSWGKHWEGALLPSDIKDFAMLPSQIFWQETVSLLDYMSCDLNVTNNSACCWEEISSYIIVYSFFRYALYHYIARVSHYLQLPQMASCKTDFLCTLTVKLTSFEWKESSPRRSAPKISHTGILPRGGLVLSLEYVRPLFVKTKNLFLKFLKPSLLLPCALFTNILQETRIFYTKYVFTIIEGYFTCWLVESYGRWEFWPWMTYRWWYFLFYLTV